MFQINAELETMRIKLKAMSGFCLFILPVHQANLLCWVCRFNLYSATVGQKTPAFPLKSAWFLLKGWVNNSPHVLKPTSRDTCHRTQQINYETTTTKVRRNCWCSRKNIQFSRWNEHEVAVWATALEHYLNKYYGFGQTVFLNLN